MLAAAVDWCWQCDGFVHWVQGGHDLPRGPLGVLLYLAAAPLYWIWPAGGRSRFLWISSLALALLSLGPAYAGHMAALALLSYAVVRWTGASGRTGWGGLVLASAYAGWLLVPQPRWLPPVDLPLYFYLQWAGIGYLFLRAYHVLADVAARRLAMPAFDDFLAYLLFAPTLRMGPLYRYPVFAGQVSAGPARHRSILRAAGRLMTAAIRLAVMGWLIDHYPGQALYARAADFSPAEAIITLYAAAMAIYLWISAYVDLSIAVGRVVGFDIPDNFNYPWRATSIDDFWRRWHITLGSWLKDYLFVPLIRRRWHYLAAFIATFLFCGVWHGLYASYTLWGLSQGLALGLRRAWAQYWRGQRDRQSPAYAFLRRCRLVDSPLNTLLCWLLTFHYQVLTISLFLDEHHTWRHLGPRLLRLLGGQ